MIFFILLPHTFGTPDFEILTVDPVFLATLFDFGTVFTHNLPPSLAILGHLAFLLSNPNCFGRAKLLLRFVEILLARGTKDHIRLLYTDSELLHAYSQYIHMQDKGGSSR